LPELCSLSAFRTSLRRWSPSLATTSETFTLLPELQDAAPMGKVTARVITTVYCSSKALKSSASASLARVFLPGAAAWRWSVLGAWLPLVLDHDFKATSGTTRVTIHLLVSSDSTSGLRNYEYSENNCSKSGYLFANAELSIAKNVQKT